MLKVGITGGIGSGKTTVCKIFETLGIPVYYADDRAKALMTTDQKLIVEIKQIFGKIAYTDDGELNKAHLAGMVFGDKSLLDQLNGIVHPAVWKDGERWNKIQEKKRPPYTLKEAALIFESGGHRYLDKIITVYAPQYLRIQRVRARDGVSAASVRARMRKQLSEKEKIKRADFVIYNNNRQPLIPQIWQIHQVLKGLAAMPS